MKIGWSTEHNLRTVIVPLPAEADVPLWMRDLKVTDAMRKPGQVSWFHGRGDEPNIVIVGVGSLDQRPAGDSGQTAKQLETVRRAAGSAGRAAEEQKADTVGISLDGLTAWIADDDQRRADVISAWTEGWLLGTYRFDKYVSEPKERSVQEMVWLAASTPTHEQAIETARIRAAATNASRDLANEPPCALRPLDLARQAERMFADRPVAVEIYEESLLRKHNMNGILAVGRGSENPPVLIRLAYTGGKPGDPPLALVGKGITFDTGGISLKKGRDLSDMRLDMSGAAAVIGAMQLIADSGMRANVIALIAAAENMPDGRSLVPGDVISYANGVHVQVGNTDAEGRLVLADALLHAYDSGAREAVDIATLTGACVVALGDKIAGVWGDEDVLDTLKEAANTSGDKVWPMPLEEEYEPLLKSRYADFSNIGKGSAAGSITAALFLKKFVHSDMRWAHIDMAGPMESASTDGYMPAGATGYGARLLADYVRLRTEKNIITSV